MIDAFEIGVNIILDDQILAGLDKVYGQFDRVQGAVDAINASLERTGGLMTPLVSQATAMASAFSSAARAARAIQSAMADTVIPAGGGGGAAPVPGAPSMVDPFGGSTTRAITTGGGGGLPALIPGQPYYSGDDGTTFRPNPYYGAGAIPPSPDSPYDPNSSPNWTPGGQPQDEPFNRPGAIPLYPGQNGGAGFDPIKGYFYSQIISSIANDVIAKPYEAAATVDQKLAVLQANGFTPQQAQQAYNNAEQMRQQTQFSTLSIDDLLGIQQAIFLQTKSMAATQAVMPSVADAAVVMKALGDTNVGAQTQNIMRAADLAGVFNGPDGTIDVARSTKFMQDFVAVEMATGDALDPNQFLHFYQNAGPAIFGLSDTGRQAAMLVAYSLGQQKAGTGLAQLTKSLQGGKMSVGNEKYLESIGLLDPSKVVPGSSRGGYIQMQEGAIKDEQLLISDPVAWVEKNIGGVSDPANMTPAQYGAMIHKIYAAANTAQSARFIGESIFQNPMILRQLAGAAQIPNLTDLATTFSMTPTGTAAAAGSATNAMVVTFSNDLMSKFQPMLEFYTKAANVATSQMQEHPTATSDLGIDAALGATWATLKTIGLKVPFARGAADLMGKLVGPLLAFQILDWATDPQTMINSQLAVKKWEQDHPGLTQPLFGWGGVPGLINLPGTSGQPNPVKPVVDAIDQQTSVVSQLAQQIVAALKGHPVPSMPIGPSHFNPHHAVPIPGQAMPSYSAPGAGPLLPGRS